MGKRVVSLAVALLLLFYAVPGWAAEKEERAWKDETVYSLMIDRFFDGNAKNNADADVYDPSSFNGGDFEGVEKKLDYLKDMGYTAIVLSPIFENEKNGYHGDWIKDFYKTDEHYGTIKEFKKLVKTAHGKDMKIMLDFQVNHVGPHHEWLDDPDKQEWFHEKKEPSKADSAAELEKAWIDGLPDLNQDHEDARRYLLDAAKWWIEETDIDGYRLTQFQYVSKDFWGELIETVKAEKPNFYIVGDTEGVDQAENTDLDIDAFMDYPQSEVMREVFAAPDQDLTALFDAYKASVAKKQEAPALFMDTQHTPRFTKNAADHNENPGTRWKLALSYLYTVPGVPVVFYGSEIALNGDQAPTNHQLMNFKTEQELVEHITKLSELRNMYPVLAKGDMDLLYNKSGMAVYKRTYNDETAVIALNNTSKTQTINIPEEQIAQNKELRGMLNGDLVRSKDNHYTIVMDREAAEVYTLDAKSTLNTPYLVVMGLVVIIFILFIILIIKRSKRNSAR